MKHVLLLLMVLGVAARAVAQGGPPMATDDPGTPGDGHWETNIGAISMHTRSGTTIDLPDADINYGLGDRIQLNLDLPWTYTNVLDGRWRAGFGDASVAVKWRFLDKTETSSLELSIYPRYQTSLSDYSERIGAASPNSEFFLPMQAAMKWHDFDIAADLGRHFVEHDADYWSAGVVVGHSCGNEDLECLAEIHREWGAGAGQTLWHLGLRWKLNDVFTLLGAVGREFGPSTDEQAKSLVYVGVQVSR